MKFLTILCHPRTRRWLTLGAGALPIAFIAGCASPGPPHAPSLNLPEVVHDLTAERTGEQVMLHWTTPEKTTDHIAIKGAMTAEICRVTTPVSQPAVPSTPACTVVTRLPVSSGPSHAEEALPSSWLAGCSSSSRTAGPRAFPPKPSLPRAPLHPRSSGSARPQSAKVFSSSGSRKTPPLRCNLTAFWLRPPVLRYIPVRPISPLPPHRSPHLEANLEKTRLLRRLPPQSSPQQNH